MVCVSLWVRSYWFEEGFSYLKKNAHIGVGSNRGHFGFATHRPVTGPEGWLWFSDKSVGGHWISNTVLGFGFEHRQNKNYPESETTVELPWWAATLVAAVPSLWLYRRQRKRRKIGFPVGAASAAAEAGRDVG
jgi:hypothetical protein